MPKPALALALIPALTIALASAVPVAADPGDPAVTVLTAKQSKTPPPKTMTGHVKRTPDGITLTLHGSGALCNAAWTVHGTRVHAETNVDAPALPSCSIVLALSPWSSDAAALELQIDSGAVRRFRVPKP